LECVILIRLLLAAALFAGVAAPQAASAEAPPEPGAIERTIPTQIRENAAAPIVQLPTRDAAPSSADHKRFTLGAVNIDGATVFSQRELSRYFEPYLATEVDQGQLSQMARAITAQYRKTGYLLSYAMVPSQNVEAGMVRLSVVEGRIDKVSVQGAGPAQGAIEAIAAPLINGGPVKSGVLERAIGLIRDFPGVTVTDIALMRSDTEDGRYTLKITLVPDRVRGFSYADNRRTGSIGRGRVYNSLSVSSLAVQGDELHVDLFAMPGGHSRYLYGQLLAAVPIGRHGLRLSVSSSRGDQYLRAEERFRGRSDNISAQLSYPFLRSRALIVTGKASLTDWRSVGTQGGTRRLRDRLRVARAGLEFGNEGKTRFQGELLLSRGLGFSGMTSVGDPLASRPDASGRFTKATFALQVSRALDDRFTFRGVAIAQYSDRPLLSAEEFSLGGNRVGRAFDFNERTGDRGAGAGAEVSYRVGKANDRTGLEVFGFVDGGVARDLKSSLSVGATHKLASTGAGARFSLAGTTIAVEAGVPLAGGRRTRLFASIFRSF
jgi:hemolysin activation/secretion protein